jgi:hypothetical protein
VPQSPPTQNDKHNEQTDHRDWAEVTPAQDGAKVLSDQRVQSSERKKLPQELKPGVRGQARSREFHAKISIDPEVIFGFSSSHCQWPFVVEEVFSFAPSSNHNVRPFFNSKLFERYARLPDWGCGFEPVFEDGLSCAEYVACP